MYEWVGEQARSGAGHEARPAAIDLLFVFFDLIGAFGVVGGMLDSLLRLGFFHRALGFFGTLGTGRGALFALFFLQLLTAEELDERRVGAVAFAPTGANDAQVSAFAVSETGSDGVEKLVHSGARHQVGQGLAARRQDRRVCPA